MSTIPYFDIKQPSLRVLFYVHVYWEMCVYVAHLVLETPRDTNDEIGDDGLDGTKGSDVLSSAMV